MQYICNHEPAILKTQGNANAIYDAPSDAKLNKVMIAIDTHTLLLKDNSYLPLNTSAETSQQLQ